MNACVLSLLLTQSAALDVTIDSDKSLPISPYIYGVNYPDTWIYDWLKEWKVYHDGFTLAREGGNRFTAYNWETNASNAGNDYFHENDDYLAVSNDPGWTVERFLNYVQPTGAAALLTVPTLGYVSADKTTERDGGRDVNHTPDYLNVRFLKSFARKPGGRLSLKPDTTDRAVYQDEFVNWVETVRSKNSPVWFALDNEPDLWSGTHARICPKPITYKGLCENNVEFASMIKDVAPGSLVFGPSNYGWNGSRTLQGAPDGGGRIFVDVYLEAMKHASAVAKKRLLDVYDFHYYPEAMGDGIRITFTNQPDKPGTATARIQAPRSLWDPNYVEESWIPGSIGGKAMRLLPDMQERVAAHYPGTKLSISEYDFGGRKSISGALAQADALGVFGRFGVFAACHWGLNHEDAAAMAGFHAFTDFDRQGHRFGDRGLPVEGVPPDQASVYASRDSKDRGRLTLILINKTFQIKEFRFSTKGFRPRTGMAYTVREGVYEIPEKSPATISNERITFTAPPLSITTIDLRSKP